MKERSIKLLFLLGKHGIEFLSYTGGVSILALQTFYYTFSRPFNIKAIILQMDFIGVKSISIVGLTALSSGMVMALQTAYGLGRFGAKSYVGVIVSLSLVRELGPILTALMVGGRVGSGITAEIGAMNVTEQIDAIKALGANPVKKLVVPRVAAAILVLPILTLFADIIGITGGMIISQIEFGISPYAYYDSVIKFLKMSDIFSGIGKSLFFGFVIAIVGCYQGMITSGGTEGVGLSTTVTVVTVSIVILISDFFLTKFFWLF